MSSMSKGLSLNIFGGSGLFNTTSLIIQSENGSSIPHKTNWDSTLSGPFVTNSTDAKNFELKLSDYSKNIHDSYYNYGINDGNYLQYNYDINWYANDIDMDDDVAVTTTKNWNSIEKNTYHLGPSGVTVDAIVSVDLITFNDGNYAGCTLSYWKIAVDTMRYNNGNGNIVFTYYPVCGEPTTASTYTLSVTPGNVYPDMYFFSHSEPTFTTTGTANRSQIDIDLDGEVVVPGTTAECKDLDGNYIGYPIQYRTFGLVCGRTDITMQCPYTSFNLKEFADILQQQKYLDSHLADDNSQIDGRLYANTPMGGYAGNNYSAHEFPDYSDVFK